MHILFLFLQCLWFFLPISMANQSAGFANKLHLPGNIPIWKWGLGQNKTWHYLYSAPLCAIIKLLVQQLFPNVNHILAINHSDTVNIFLLGLVQGVGVVFGDWSKSFIKRRMGIPPGAKFFPWDQTDYIFGTVILQIPLIGWIGWSYFLCLLSIALAIHPVGNFAGYKFGLRKTPW